MVFEGGALEHDGHGTVMATRSSVTHSSRNPDLTEQEIEQYLTTYLGITKFGVFHEYQVQGFFEISELKFTYVNEHFKISKVTKKLTLVKNAKSFYGLTEFMVQKLQICTLTV